MSTKQSLLPLWSYDCIHFDLLPTELLNIQPKGSHQAAVMLFDKLLQHFKASISC